MPALLDAASQNIVEVAGTATSGTVSTTHAANPKAQSLWGLAYLYLAANVDTSSGVTVGVTFGGTAMTETTGARTYFDGNKNLLTVFELQGPPTGAKTVEASVSGLTGNANGFWLMLDVVTYAGVQTVGNPVTVSGDTAGAQTTNSVTVASGAPADRVVTAHALRSPHLFSANNLTARANMSGVYAYIAYLLSFLGFNFVPYVATAAGGGLLVQDASGAASVTGTATQASTAQWGAIGLPLAAAPVVLEVTVEIDTSISASMSIQRALTPVAERYWEIPAQPGIMPDGSPAPLAGQFIRSASGIIMPLWPKDPNDVLDYTLGLQNHLADDDPIVAASFTVSNAELGIVSSSFTDSTIQVILSGSVTGVSYRVTGHLTTEHGRQMDWSFAIAGGQN